MWSQLMDVSKTLLSYKTLTHAVAGSSGAVVAMTVFFPLDTVRSRMQLDDKLKGSILKVIKELLRREGSKTLYVGLLPVLQSVCASNFVYFYTFHGLKLMHGKAKDQSASKDLILACIAGAINVLSTTPLWVVNTRMKMQHVDASQHKYSSLIDGLQKIAATEGWARLWSGTLPSLILVSNPAIQFMTYEALKRQLQRLFPASELGPMAFFFVGALAKAVATLITYPLQVLQTKLRHGHSYEDLRKDADALQLASYIISKHGVNGLYKGMEAKLLQTVLTAALMFATYEKIAAFVFTLLRAPR